MNRYILLFLHIVSLVFLAFGWIKDLLQIEIKVHYFVEFTLFNEKRSLLGMLEKLWNSSNYWPFLLIFLFGIIVPILKSGVIFFILLGKKPHPKWQLFVSAISKWAMADVFAISIFVAFLGANAMENTTSILLPGFYYFSVYVLLSAFISILSSKLIANTALNKV